MRRLVIVLAGIVGVLAACSSSTVATSKEPNLWQPVGTPGSSILSICDHGNRLYMLYDHFVGPALAVVSSDPTCN